MVSRALLESLPDPDGFRRIAQSLATLDAILSPDWQSRYYSFDSRWSASEMMASMRNGSGDEWFAIICPAGVAVVGLDHESPTFTPGESEPWVFSGLPRAFHENLREQPSFDTANSTWCIWRSSGDDRWRCGPGAEDAEDGSTAQLEVLLGRPEDYVEFARDYYERDIDVADVAAVYAHAVITDELASRINPDVGLEAMRKDLDEIGYP